MTETIIRLIVVLGLGSGSALLIDHIAHYGLAFHLALLDHGVWGIGILVISLGLGIGYYRWRRGKK